MLMIAVIRQAGIFLQAPKITTCDAHFADMRKVCDLASEGGLSQ